MKEISFLSVKNVMPKFWSRHIQSSHKDKRLLKPNILRINLETKQIFWKSWSINSVGALLRLYLLPQSTPILLYTNAFVQTEVVSFVKKEHDASISEQSSIVPAP